MDKESKYSIHLNSQFGQSTQFDIASIVNKCKEKWFNQTLCQVNDCVVRLGIVEGEFHWHQHDDEDELFFVLHGVLLLDLESETITLRANQGYVVPKGVVHKTRAPKRTVMLMIEGSGVDPIGD